MRKKTDPSNRKKSAQSSARRSRVKAAESKLINTSRETFKNSSPNPFKAQHHSSPKESPSQGYPGGAFVHQEKQVSQSKKLPRRKSNDRTTHNAHSAKKDQNNGWEDVSAWYQHCVGNEGHYYHQTLILPRLLPELAHAADILDLGCGEGILQRALLHQSVSTLQSKESTSKRTQETPNKSLGEDNGSRPLGSSLRRYVGIDASRSLLRHARERNEHLSSKLRRDHAGFHPCEKLAICSEFIHFDLSSNDSLAETITSTASAGRGLGDKFDPALGTSNDFSDAIFLLSLQNISKPAQAIEHAGSLLRTHGRLHLILNHPCFRIPRQTHWGYDEKSKIQYRRIDTYRQFLQIPIASNPSLKGSHISHSYHFSLSDLTCWLQNNGFSIECIDELYSTKKSQGARARAENRAREQIPLFLYLRARRR